MTGSSVQSIFDLRPAQLADVPALLQIYRPQVLEGTASYETDPPDEAEFARRLTAVQAEGLPWLVAAADGQALGYAYASPFRSRPGYRYTVENSVYVGENARGMGVGRGLLQRLINECTSLGFRRMVAVIGDRRNTASIALHRAAGFVEVGVVPAAGFKHGEWLDWLLMQRPLGEGAETKPKPKPP